MRKNMSKYDKLTEEQEKAKHNAENKLAEQNKGNKEIIDPEFQKSKSITHNGIKFALGEKGEYKGHPYSAAFKIRTKNVQFDKEFNNYKVGIPYLSLAAFLTWLKQPENMDYFSSQVKLEKEAVAGISDSF